MTKREHYRISQKRGLPIGVALEVGYLGLREGDDSYEAPPERRVAPEIGAMRVIPAGREIIEFLSVRDIIYMAARHRMINPNSILGFAVPNNAPKRGGLDYSQPRGRV